MHEPKPLSDDIIFMIKADADGRHAALDAVRNAFPRGLPCKLRPEGVIHATLVLAGSASDARTEATAREMAALVRLPPFEMVFDTLTGFGGNNGVLAVTCSHIPSAWAPLRKQLTQVPRRLGFPIEGGAQPHLTMAYGCPAFAAIMLAEPVVWSVDAFRLVRSLRGQSHHEDLDRWALR